MSRMVDACRAQSVPEPEYEVNGGFVRIVFRRATKGDDSVNEGVNGYVNGYVNAWQGTGTWQLHPAGIFSYRSVISKWL